jgi:hypothetical protein
MELIHHLLPDLRALYFSVPLLLKINLDSVDDLLYQVDADRSLLTGLFHPIENFDPIKCFSPSIFLHYQRKGILCPLRSSESLLTAQTFPPSTDGLFILTQAGIDHLTLRVVTKWTFHILNHLSSLGSDQRGMINKQCVENACWKLSDT